MNNLPPLARHRPRGIFVSVRYEKSGLTLYELPVPWNADAVVIEATLRLPPSARRKSDFALHFPGSPPLAPESLRTDADDRHRLLFRVPTPPQTTAAELLHKNRLLASVHLPIVREDDFFANLRLTHANVAVRLGNEVIAAKTFVAGQCRGLVATAVLSGPTPLAPLAEVGVHALYRNERTGLEHAVPVPLSSTQLAAKEAVLTAVPPTIPRRVGGWSVAWVVGRHVLGRKHVHGILSRQFETSLRVSDTRFVIADKSGAVRVVRQLPPLADVARLGPCFLVASHEPGMAGVCRLSIHTAVAGCDNATLLMEQDVLVTDGPTLFAPGLLDVADILKLTNFELRHKSRLLGSLSLSPVPRAALNAEGGFKPTPDFTWSNAAEDELNERLHRLMNGGEE